VSRKSEAPAAAPEPPAAATPGARDPAALATFLASLAHDLRSPLGIVAETINELRASFAGQLSDEHRLLTTLADRGLLRLGRIADAVSLTATLESKTLVIQGRSRDLVELLRAAVDAATALEPRREVELESLLPDGPCLIVADGDRLTRALTEIVINAIRFARRAARIRLEIGPREARVSVEDDGQGIPPEQRPGLFERFARRASRSGLGVGLSNAQAVVRAHGGQITLEASTLPAGRTGTLGACFVIALPIEGIP
jgi:two-component system sensor histidine kinase ResE